MKKTLIGILAIAIVTSLAACGETKEKESGDTTAVTSGNQVSSETETKTETENKNEEKVDPEDEARYESVALEYDKAIAELISGDFETEDEIAKNYPLVSDVLAIHIARYASEGVEITYNYLDIDNNGVKEMIAGANNSSAVIYSYDTNLIFF